MTDHSVFSIDPETPPEEWLWSFTFHVTPPDNTAPPLSTFDKSIEEIHTQVECRFGRKYTAPIRTGVKEDATIPFRRHIWYKSTLIQEQEHGRA